MPKIKKPLKKSELLNIIEQGWDARRAAAKMRSARNSKWTKEWKLRQLENKDKENVKRQKHYIGN